MSSLVFQERNILVQNVARSLFNSACKKCNAANIPSAHPAPVIIWLQITMEKSIITTSSCEGPVELKHKTICLKSPSSRAWTRWSLLWLYQVVLCQNMVNLSESNPFIYILHLMEKKVVEVAFFCLYSSNIAIIFVPQQSLFCHALVTFPERLGAASAA